MVTCEVLWYHLLSCSQPPMKGTARKGSNLLSAKDVLRMGIFVLFILKATNGIEELLDFHLYVCL